MTAARLILVAATSISLPTDEYVHTTASKNQQASRYTYVVLRWLRAVCMHLRVELLDGVAELMRAWVQLAFSCQCRRELLHGKCQVVTAFRGNLCAVGAVGAYQSMCCVDHVPTDFS